MRDVPRGKASRRSIAALRFREFVQRQVRIFVRADIRDEEQVRVRGQGSGGETLREYLLLSRAARLRSRLYNLAWVALMLPTFAAFVAVAASGAPPWSWRIGIALFSLVVLAFGLRQLAGWRCMRRYRNERR